MLISHPRLVPALLIAALTCGCAGESEPASKMNGLAADAATASANGDATAQSSSNESASSNPSKQGAAARITASIPSGAASENPDGNRNSESLSDRKEEVQSTDEVTKLLAEAQQLRIAAVPSGLEPAAKARRERNERIVELATNVLRLTINDQSRQAQFHQAIGQLLEARFQMALAGTTEDVEQLYADVQLLNDHDSKSPAAAEGVYYIAKFAHTKASLLGKSQPQWFETLSRWAREFADRFPDQSTRAVTLLFGAARTCELHSVASTDAELASRLMTEAKLCYTALAEHFPKSDQGQEAASILRRMTLPGKALSQFAGPTIDGGYVSVDEFPGKPTLIYFWESEAPEFVEQLLPVLQKIRAQVSSDRLRIVGVAMDDDESTLEEFMASHAVPGQQIFFPNVEQRSWNSPLIRFWGISKCPSIWLLDDKGVIVSISATSTNLTSLLEKIVR